MYVIPISLGFVLAFHPNLRYMYIHFERHILKPETTKQNHRNETSETKPPKLNHQNKRNDQNKITETAEIYDMDGGKTFSAYSLNSVQDCECTDCWNLIVSPCMNSFWELSPAPKISNGTSFRRHQLRICSCDQLSADCT